MVFQNSCLHIICFKVILMWPIKIYIILHLPFEGNTCHLHNNFEWDSNTEKLVTTVVNRDLWQDDILWVNVSVTEIYQSSSLVWLKSQYLHRSLSCLVLLLLLTIFLHAHLQAVYYNCVKFHKNSISNLVGVALTRYMPPPFSWKYKLNYLPF